MTMSGLDKHSYFNAIRAILTIGALATMSVTAVRAADDVTEGQILRALAPKKPLTRSLSMTPPAEAAPPAAETRFVDSLRNRSTRSLSIGEREQIAAVIKDKPNIDLEITFDYDSARIGRKAKPAVEALGRALTNPELKGSTFLVAGHTDAAGSDAYNQDLSERRADAVKTYLVDRFGIPAADLVTVGYGESRLKRPDAPDDAANRRVQVVNMQTKTSASK
jgi:outer membrane protein OmpA-like peptidoglycan-associated protein